MAKTAILTKDGLVRYDSNIKDYIKDLTDDTIYIDPDETSSEIENIDSVTSAKYVSYNNADSGLEATNVQEAIDTVSSITKGKNRARVFSTTEDMNAWLSDETNKGIALVGDNLYIVELDVPDWWISEVLEEADAETGFYYKIAQLETQKVDLTTIESELDNKVSKTDIVDNLMSSVIDVPLSANQGNVLNTMINGKGSMVTKTLRNGASISVDFQYGGNVSFIAIVSVSAGPNGYGIYHGHFGSSKTIYRILETTSSGSAFSTTTENGLTITAGSGITICVTIIYSSGVIIS